MQRTTCGGCGSAALEPFLDLGKTPLADAFPKAAGEPETWYPLNVAVCTSCWLVQLLEVVPDDELFGADYGFYSGTSPSLVEYHWQYAADVMSGPYAEQAKRLTVEIACNDGSLLKEFAAAGCSTVGIDPAGGPTQAARDAGLDVLTAPFTAHAADLLRGTYGPAGLIVANHVLAHTADLHDFLAGVDVLLAEDGAAIFEFHYLPDLLVGNQWDHIYHEHRYYFSLTSLWPLLGQHGLTMKRAQPVSREGGSMRVTVTRGERPASSPYDAAYGMTNLGTYQAIQGRVDYLVRRLSETLYDEKFAGRSLAGYAASAKSTTLLNYAQIGPDLLDYVVDTTPHKIGRFTPGTHIPIVGPGATPDTFLLLSWNYLPGVLRREREFIDNGGKFIVPIPTPVLL